MDKFTPGPWRVGQGSFVISDAPVAGVDGADAVSYYGGYLICESVNGPNAQLIASAPDLLAACEAVTRAFTAHQCDAYGLCEAAIAKARGEEK